MPVLGIVASSILKSSGSFESIATATGNNVLTSLSFTSIPSTYKSLQIRYSAAALAGGAQLQMRFNSDTATNYWYHETYGNGTSATANFGSAGYFYIDVTGGVSASPNTMGGVMDILDYSSAVKKKVFKSNNTIQGPSTNYVSLVSGVWNSASALSTITFTLDNANAFAAGTSFALYGVK